MAVYLTVGADLGEQAAASFLAYLPATSGRRAAVLERLMATGHQIDTAADLPDALRLLGGRPVALCLLDLPEDGTALPTIRAIRAQYPHVPLAGVMEPGNPLLVAEAIHAGVGDVLPWPFELPELATLLANARDLARVDPQPRAGVPAVREGLLIAHSSAMRRVLELVGRAVRSRAGVCVCGEPGTGRTLVARTIHDLGAVRGDEPFVVVDCAGHTPQELDRHLFGQSPALAQHAPALASDQIGRDGALYRARGGTLMLRNVVDAPSRVQARLARLLRDREAILAGPRRTPVDLDVRPIAIVETTVEVALAEGRLRRDLCKQLSNVSVDVPPLRRRREDIPLLAVQMLRQTCTERQIAPKAFSRSALQVLTALPWNGNADELRTLITTLAGAVEPPVIQLEDLLAHTTLGGVFEGVEAGVTLRDARARFERDCISAVLMQHHGRVPEAAKALGIQRTNLYRKIRQLNVARSLLSARR